MNVYFSCGAFLSCLGAVGCSGIHLATTAYPDGWAVQDWAAYLIKFNGIFKSIFESMGWISVSEFSKDIYGTYVPI